MSQDGQPIWYLETDFFLLNKIEKILFIVRTEINDRVYIW